MFTAAQMRCLTSIALVAFAACPIRGHAAAKVDDKSAVEATVRGMEQAVQDYDFARQNSLLTRDARWIERSLPEPAASDGTGFFAESKSFQGSAHESPPRFQHTSPRQRSLGNTAGRRHNHLQQ
jgi:hypothetical protein